MGYGAKGALATRRTASGPAAIVSAKWTPVVRMSNGPLGG